MAATWENTAAMGQTEPDRRGKTANPRLILAVIGLTCGLLGSFGLTACTNSLPEKPAATAPAVETGPVVAESWPLTGLDRPDGGPRRPAVAVKIENTASARPQSGLESADIVFEEMVEGGLTRFNAIFHSQTPEEIGPVRSVRPMDTAIAAPFGAILVYSGGVPQFEAKVKAAGLRGYNEDEALGASYRVNWRRMPHNLYLSIPKLFEKVGIEGVPEPDSAFDFARNGENPTVVDAGVPAGQILVNFPSARVRFDWNGSKWQRVDEGMAVAARSGAPLQADNVVVIKTTTIETTVRDAAGFPVPETVLEGGGQAYVATGGKVMDAEWYKDSEGSPLRLTDVAGAPIVLAPGQTWVELLAAGSFSYQ